MTGSPRTSRSGETSDRPDLRRAHERVLARRQHDVERELRRRLERLDLAEDPGLVGVREHDAVHRARRRVLDREHRAPRPRRSPVGPALRRAHHDPPGLAAAAARQRERSRSTDRGDRNDRERHGAAEVHASPRPEASLANRLRTRGGYTRFVRSPLHLRIASAEPARMRPRRTYPSRISARAVPGDRLDCSRGSYEAELMSSGPRLKYRQLPLSILAALLRPRGVGRLWWQRGSVACRSQRRHEHAVADSAVDSDVDRMHGCSAGPPARSSVEAQFSFPKGLGYEALQVPALGRRAAGTAYLVFLPQQLWIKPVVNRALPEGHLWISATFTDSRSAGSTTPSLALALESMNPQLLLEEIATGAVAASSSGHRVIDHVPFTEYVVSVDLARALAAAGTPEPFVPRCSRSSPRSAQIEARTRARGCGSWPESTEQGASRSCKHRCQARSWARFRSRCGSSAARSR